MKTGQKPANLWIAAVLGAVTWGLGFYYAGLSIPVSLGLMVLLGGIEIAIQNLPEMLLPWKAAYLTEMAMTVTVFVVVVTGTVLLAKRRALTRLSRTPVSYALMVLATVVYMMLTGVATDLYRLDPVRIFTVEDATTEPGVIIGDHLYVNTRTYRQKAAPTGTLVIYQDPEQREKIHVRRISSESNPSPFLLIGEVKGIVWNEDRNDRYLMDVP